jgi:hypothetical protein
LTRFGNDKKLPVDVWEIGGDEKALDKPIERAKETTKAIANPAYFL